MNMQLEQALQLAGHVTIRAHDPDYEYSRDTYQTGEIVHDDHNTIQSSGIAYILAMLLADATNEGSGQPRKFGITQIGLIDTGAIERWKADLTDQYISGSSIVNVLYIASINPPTQPHNVNAARLYLDTAGTTVLATSSYSSFQKTSTLALTLEWTLTLTGV